MVIECHSREEVLELLTNIEIKTGINVEKLATRISSEYEDDFPCVNIDLDDMRYIGWCSRLFYAKRGYKIVPFRDAKNLLDFFPDGDLDSILGGETNV